MDQIASLVLSILQAFRILIPVLELAVPTEAATARSNLARFKLWAGSVGAHRASGMRSLAYRLRDASKIRLHVISLLEELRSSLGEGKSCYQIIYPIPLPLSRIRQGSESSQLAVSSLSKSSDPPADVPEYDSIDADLAYVLGDTEDDPNNGFDRVAEMSRCLIQVGELIDCLLRLSVTISNPAPYDQFRSRVDVQTSYFEPYDVNHVQEKFPKLDSSIVRRLGRALTHRRQYFKYREDRHRRLKEGLEPDEAGYARSEGGATTVASPIPQNMCDSTLLDLNVADAPVSENSATTYAHTDTMGDSTVRIPAIPRDNPDDPFLCPFCFRMIKLNTQHEWKKHIFRDLRPYVCIWDDCVSSGQSFQKRKEWIRHMTTQHWRQWICPFGCSPPFNDCQALETHLKEAHAGELSSQVIDHVSALSSLIDANKAKTKCPMCQEFEVNTIRQYGSHIGHHLEQIALFALPNMDDSGRSENEKDISEEKEEDESEEDSLEHDPEGGSKSAEVDGTKIDNTDMYPIKSGFGTEVEAKSEEISTALSMSRIDSRDELSRPYRETETEPGGQQNEDKDKGNSVYGKAEAESSRKDGQESTESVELSDSLDRLSISPKHDVYLGGEGVGSSSRRSRHVKEKKWHCAWCQFGPLDWTYDTHCVDCGRPRDQYCGVQYQNRKVGLN